MRADAVTGLVLCGGAGRRLGGADKPLSPYRGIILLEHVLARLRPQVGRVLLSANRNLERYRSYAPVVTDREGDYPGPLGGFHAAATVLETPYLFVCPGDGPDLPDIIVRRLLAALQASACEAAVAHDGRARQPLHVLLRADALASLDVYLASGARSVHGWLDTLDTCEIDFSDRPDGFRNLNEPADFR